MSQSQPEAAVPESWRTRITRGAIVLAVTATTLLQLADCRSEYTIFDRERFESFHAHHDEKLEVCDARYLFLRGREEIELLDFKPHPFSAIYGVLGPQLLNLGFRTLGYDNRGLRAPYILVSGVAALLVALALVRAAPGWPGELWCALYLASYSRFAVGRLAVLEHIATLYLAALAYLYFARRSWFIAHTHWLALVSGSSILFKPNFPVTMTMFLMAVVLVECPDRRRAVARVLAWSLAGLVVFEGAQMIALYRLDVLPLRYAGLLETLRHYRGESEIGALHGFAPRGVDSVLRSLTMLLELCAGPLKIHAPDVIGSPDVGLASASVGLLAPALLLAGGWSRLLAASDLRVLIVFLVTWWVSIMPLHFYLKTALPVLPVGVVLACVLCREVVRSLGDPSRPSFRLARCGMAVAGACLVVMQVGWFAEALARRTREVEDNSRALERRVPRDARVFAHCYAFRFFWQARGVRFISIEDLYGDNLDVVNLAISSGGRHVLLSRRGLRKPYYRPGAGSPSILGVASPIAGRLQLVARFHTSEESSDWPDDYELNEIR
jgi:hypothetical protein